MLCCFFVLLYVTWPLLLLLNVAFVLLPPLNSRSAFMPRRLTSSSTFFPRCWCSCLRFSPQPPKRLTASPSTASGSVDSNTQLAAVLCPLLPIHEQDFPVCFQGDHSHSVQVSRGRPGALLALFHQGNMHFFRCVLLYCENHSVFF